MNSDTKPLPDINSGNPKSDKVYYLDDTASHASNTIESNNSSVTYRTSRNRLSSEVSILNDKITPAKDGQPRKSRSLPALDGGWGWCVVFGCCLMHFLLGGYGRSFGIIYVKMLERFDCSAATGSTIGGVFTSVRMGAGPLISVLTQRFSVRSVTSVGALVFALGSLLCAFVTSPFQMFLTYSLLSGLGGAMVYFPAIVIVGQYFDKRRGLAMGLSTAGSGIGCMVFPPIYHILLNVYGFWGTFIIVSGFILNFLICSALYRPLANSWRGINAGIKRKFQVDVEEANSQKDFSDIGGAVDSLPSASHRVNGNYSTNELIVGGIPCTGSTINSVIQDEKEFKQLNRQESQQSETKSHCSLLDSHYNNSEFDASLCSNNNFIRIESDLMTTCKSTGSIRLISSMNDDITSQIYSGTGDNKQVNKRRKSLDFANISRTRIQVDRSQSLIQPEESEVALSGSSSSSDVKCLSSSEDDCLLGEEEDQPLLVPSQEQALRSRWQKIDSYIGLSLLANPALTCFILASGLGTMAYISSQNLIVAHSIKMGINPNLSVYILSTIGIADTTGRVLSGVLFDIPVIRRLRMFLYTFILLGSGISIIGWGFCTNIIQMLALSFVNGVFNGGIVTSRAVIVADLVGIENMSQAFGMTVFSQGVFIIIGPFVAGYLKDITQDYVMSYVFTGLCSCLAAFLYFVGYKIGRKSWCCKC